MYFPYCGLYPIVGGKPESFPLINTKVHYDLVDVQALATVIQTYVSNATTPLDVKYVFPLPPDASVCAFEAVINGQRTIKGVVKEKEKAKAEYDEAVSKGKTAGLLEQSNVEIFQLSLGNIHPEETVEVHISFAIVISHNGDLDSLRLTFPCAIAPRYGTPPNKLLNFSSRTWPCKHVIIEKFKAAVDFSLSVQMTSHIKSVTSPSHTVEMKIGQSSSESTTDFDPLKAHVSLTSPTLLDKDIVIAMSCVGLDKPRCTVEAYSPAEGAQEHTSAYALTLVPRFDLPPLASQEYIFLVDRSGSMDGGKINAVRSALQIMLKSLPSQGTSFNIVSFGSSHSALYNSSVPYNANSVKDASKHVDNMKADYGGTEIRGAIDYAFKISGSKSQTPVSIFVLTDGEAYDLNGVQDAVAAAVAAGKNSNNLFRLFCMGIGDAVSKAMCDLIARVGQGTAVYVGETEKPDLKLMALLRAARGGVVENISIDWGVGAKSKADDDFELVSAEDAPPPDYPKENNPPISLFDEKAVPDVTKEKAKLGPDSKPIDLPPPAKIQQAPTSASLPPLYPGFRTSIFAIIANDEMDQAPSKTVCINGTVMGQNVKLEVSVTQAIVPHGSAEKKVKMLHVLAARALVQRFEDERKTASFDLVKKAEVLRIAERYGIASSETSFVAIDENSVNVGLSTGKQNPVSVRAMEQDYRARSSFSSTGTVVYGSFQQSLSGAGASPPPPPPPPGRRAPLPRSPPPRSPPPGGPSSGIFSAVSARLSRSLAPASYSPVPGPPQSQPATTSPAMAPVGSMSRSERYDDDGDDGFAVFGAAQAPAKKLFGGGLRGGGGGGGDRGGLFGSAKGGVPVETEEKLRKHERTSSSDLAPAIETFARVQDFEGFFPPSTPLYKLLVNSPLMPVLPAILNKAGNEAEKIWCTVLCVVYLKAKFGEEKDVWAIMVEKALQWVDDTLQSVVPADKVAETQETLREEAGKLVKL